MIEDGKISSNKQIKSTDLLYIFGDGNSSPFSLFSIARY